jgi:eukaryotic-like serine/threonine-protein kinase
MDGDKGESPTKSSVRQTVGHYRILSMLGKGGMGEVYLGEDSRLGRKVAIKLLPARFTSDTGRLRRFAQESRAASALNHPNIITIHEIGEASTEQGTTHYIVTEYVEGEALRQRMASTPPKNAKSGIEVVEAIEITSQIAAALSAAHESGIMHRDIKAENVMVRHDGIVKVLDFGLAKLTEGWQPGIGSQVSTLARNDTETGVVIGTPRYMSPEQTRGEKLDARTDVFSLGVLLYEMIAGRAPFAGDTLNEVVAAILRDDPPPLTAHTPEIPPKLQRIISQALQKKREERYQTVNKLLTDLKLLKRQLERKDELKDELARASQHALEGETAAGSNGGVASPANALKPAKRTGNVAPADTTVKLWFGGRRAAQGARRLHAGARQLGALSVCRAWPGDGDRLCRSLAFVNGSNDPNLEYLSDGLTESLINGLSQLSKLRVMSLSAVFRYRGRENDAQAIGKALGVRGILMGPVVPNGDALFVSAELVDARDNSHLWGEQYHRKLSDVVAIQGEISREVAKRLQPRLSGEEQKRLTKHDTENAQAYQLYLQGRFHWNKQTAEGMRQAIDFRQAISLDSKYALAYTGLADSYNNLGLWGYAPPREVYPEAIAAAMKALALDDSLAEAHTSLGHLKFEYYRDLAGAERAYKRAIELNPRYYRSHMLYAVYMATMGRWPEASAEIERAQELEQELDPYSCHSMTFKGISLYFSGQSDQAIEQLQKTTAKDANFWQPHHWLSQVYAQKRMYPEALVQAQKARELQGVGSAWLARYIYAVSGQRGATLHVIGELKELSRERYISPYDFAQIYAGLGDQDQAFAWLEKGYADRAPLLDNLNVNPIFDGLRADPRYANLAQRMGFTP